MAARRFTEHGPVRTSPLTRDRAAAERLWEISAELVRGPGRPV